VENASPIVAVGIDVGGTKIAAGRVDVASGRILEQRRLPTRAERGGAAVLEDCASLAAELGGGSCPVGIGLCELVSLDGRPTSAETVDWRSLDVSAAFESPAVVLEADVRAAARAEARFGAGRGRSPFLYIVCGTGASACLVVDGVPYAGAHGHAITLGAPPVESVASGKALAAAAKAERAEDVLGDPAKATLVGYAAALLAQVLAVLANALDPELVVLGGGLGSAPTFRSRVESEFRPLVEYPPVPDLVGPAVEDGGIVGAALRAAEAAR
jgi:glucokinase